MSDKASATAERVRGYLVSQLRRNPQLESGTIVERRASALGLNQQKKPVREEGADRSELRQRSLQALEQVRSTAFQAPVPQLLEKLDNLQLAHFPDLQMLEGRLRTIVECRQALPPLTSHRHFNGDFWACLKQVLTSPARESAVLREQVIASFQRWPNRRRGKAMIKLLKKDLPQLYALEGEWLETLLRFQPRANTSGEGGGDVGEMIAANWLLIPVAVVVLIVVVGLIAAFGGDKSPSRRARQAVVPPNAGPLGTPQYHGADPFAAEGGSEQDDSGDLARRQREERQREEHDEYLRRGMELVNQRLRERKERQRELRGEAPDDEEESNGIDAEELERQRQESIEAFRQKQREQMEKWNRQGASGGAGPGSPSRPEAGATAPFATPRVAPVTPLVPGQRP